MKSTEFLRKLADLIDDAEQPCDPNQNPNKAVLTPVEAENEDQAETSVMIPPLQQKIELLKKAVGVDSTYDDLEDEEFLEDDDAELNAIKKNAGIMAAIIDNDDDFPE